jgi:hypothetical protein
MRDGGAKVTDFLDDLEGGLVQSWQSQREGGKEPTLSVQGRRGRALYCVVASPGEAMWWEPSKLS